MQLGKHVRHCLNAVDRAVRASQSQGQPAHSVVLARSFDVTAVRLWHMLTRKEHLARWLGPISGRFEPDGHFALQGNAQGDILACDRPRHLRVTWQHASEVDRVDVRLEEESAGGVRLSLTHTAIDSPHWTTYGPGAVGLGWEMALMGLWICLAETDAPLPDPATFLTSSDGITFVEQSSEAWCRAAVAAGDDPATAQAAARRTAAFYRGDADGLE